MKTPFILEMISSLFFLSLFRFIQLHLEVEFHAAEIIHRRNPKNLISITYPLALLPPPLSSHLEPPLGIDDVTVAFSQFLPFNRFALFVCSPIRLWVEPGVGE